jgi:hypothetical protein
MISERLRQAIERASVLLAPEQQDEFADRLLVKLAEDESGVAEFVLRLYAGLSAAFDAVDDGKCKPLRLGL